MVIDSSAIMAILLGEPGAEIFAGAIEEAGKIWMSSVNLLETAMVIESRKGDLGRRDLDLLLHKARIEVVSFGENATEEAMSAWRRWGKGRHEAGLNFCDCCAYALAKNLGEPLLYKGNDFSKTDIVSALGGHAIHREFRA